MRKQTREKVIVHSSYRVGTILPIEVHQERGSEERKQQAEIEKEIGRTRVEKRSCKIHKNTNMTQ